MIAYELKDGFFIVGNRKIIEKHCKLKEKKDLDKQRGNKIN